MVMITSGIRVVTWLFCGLDRARKHRDCIRVCRWQ